MLVVYDVRTSAVVSLSGYRGVASKEAIERVVPVDGLPDGQAFFHIFDSDQIQNAWKLWDASRSPEGGFQCVVSFDEDGNPIGIDRAPEPEQSTEEKGSGESGMDSK